MTSRPDASARFEISPRGTEWQWLLYDDGVMLAQGPEAFETVRDSLGAIEQLREVASREIYDGQAGYETVEQDGQWLWRLVVGERGAEQTLATGSTPFETEQAAAAAVNGFRDSVPDAPVRIEHPPAQQPTTDRFDVGRRGSPIKALRSVLSRGKRHRKLSQRAEMQIVVSGTRGKSSTAKRLNDIFNRRGYETLTKITGDRPTVLGNDDIVPIERHSPRVTLYENTELFQSLGSTFAEDWVPEVAIVENQALTEYTMRMINERFLQPDVVVLCNVRQDHTDTLGSDRLQIARSFARSIPAGTHVVSGEQNPVIHEYLSEEIRKRGATISQVEIPERHRGLIGAETVYALNDVLATLDQPALSEAELAGYLASTQPAWSVIDGQRVFNAAKTNDVESTEAIRRALVDGDEQILPFVYLRGDRRSRSASFAEYLNILADRDCITAAHVGGENRRAFADAVDVPCTLHSTEADAEAVLEELLEDGRPILFMGNTVAPFMREMERVLAGRIAESAVAVAGSDLDETGSESVVESLQERFSEAAPDAATAELPRTNGATFEVYRDKAKEYRWRFRDTEGTIRADSGEGYTRHGSAITAAGRFRTQATTLRVEIYEDKAGKHRWRAQSKNGRIVADGTRGYGDRSQAERAVEDVRHLVTESPIADLADASATAD